MYRAQVLRMNLEKLALVQRALCLGNQLALDLILSRVRRESVGLEQELRALAQTPVWWYVLIRAGSSWDPDWDAAEDFNNGTIHAEAAETIQRLRRHYPVLTKKNVKADLSILMGIWTSHIDLSFSDRLEEEAEELLQEVRERLLLLFESPDASLLCERQWSPEWTLLFPRRGVTCGSCPECLNHLDRACAQTKTT